MKKRKVPVDTKPGLRDLAEFRRVMGPAAANYTEAQLRVFQRDIFTMAEICFHLHFSGKNPKSGAGRARQSFDDKTDTAYDDGITSR